MAWDKNHIRDLLDEVANTRDHASVQKADELLQYLAGWSDKQEAAGKAGSMETSTGVSQARDSKE